MADTGRLDELKRKFEDNPKRYFAPLANEYRKAGEPEMAIELCRTYLPQQPTHMSGYIVYGQALQDAGQVDESAAVFKQALTLDPENIIALRNLGDIARDAGDSAGAMRWYGKVLEMDPRNEEISAYITAIASPAGQPPAPRAPERVAPPTVRPEPEPDASAVRLEDIVSEPDMQQMPIMADEPAQDSYDAAYAAQAYTDESDQPFEVTEWPSAMQPDAADDTKTTDASASSVSDDSNVLEGPWHATAPLEETGSTNTSGDLSEDVPVEPAVSDEEEQEQKQELEPPLRLSDYMPEEEAAFAPTSEELGESDSQHAPTEATEAPRAPTESPFVTETMAELYMRQGLRGEALTIYRQLALKRDDPKLRERIAELEAHKPAAPKGETVRDFFARIGARVPNERVQLAADRTSPLSALFPSSQPDAADVTAARRLSGAFGDPRSADSQS